MITPGTSGVGNWEYNSTNMESNHKIFPERKCKSENCKEIILYKKKRFHSEWDVFRLSSLNRETFFQIIDVIVARKMLENCSDWNKNNFIRKIISSSEFVPFNFPIRASVLKNYSETTLVGLIVIFGWKKFIFLTSLKL